MATYTIEANLEQFTEADAENLEFTLEDLEDLEAESIEGIDLEDVESENVAESLEDSIEGEEAFRGLRPRSSRAPRNPSKAVNKELLKTFTNIVKKLVEKSMSNPKTRTKLQAAARKGPSAVAHLLTPSVSKMLPSYSRWMAPIYVPLVVSALYHPIRNQVGIKAEEVEEAPEFFPLIINAIRMAAQLGIGIHRHKKNKKK